MDSTCAELEGIDRRWAANWESDAVCQNERRVRDLTDAFCLSEALCHSRLGVEEH